MLSIHTGKNCKEKRNKMNFLYQESNMQVQNQVIFLLVKCFKSVGTSSKISTDILEPQNDMISDEKEEKRNLSSTCKSDHHYTALLIFGAVFHRIIKWVLRKATAKKINYHGSKRFILTRQLNYTRRPKGRDLKAL